MCFKMFLFKALFAEYRQINLREKQHLAEASQMEMSLRLRVWNNMAQEGISRPREIHLTRLGQTQA